MRRNVIWKAKLIQYACFSLFIVLKLILIVLVLQAGVSCGAGSSPLRTCSLAFCNHCRSCSQIGRLQLTVCPSSGATCKGHYSDQHHMSLFLLAYHVLTHAMYPVTSRIHSTMYPRQPLLGNSINHLSAGLCFYLILMRDFILIARLIYIIYLHG
jgi:hypothetical protein